MSRTRVPTKVGATLRAAAIAVAVAGALTACGSDEETSQQDPQDVATGTVLDGAGGAPVSGVDVELLVWPSPQGGGATPVGEAPELIRVDEARTADDGTFDLEALARDLSPHAGSDGQVSVEIRKVGAAGAGLRTIVRLSRGQDNGEFKVHTIEGLELTSAELGDS